MHLHTELDKQGIIEVIAKLQAQADDFNKTKETNKRLLFVIYNFGYNFPCETNEEYKPDHDNTGKKMDDSTLKGSDGSQYHCQYVWTSDDKLIGMNEYGVRLTNNNESTHVLILDECRPELAIDFHCHELVHDKRPGQARVTYGRDSDIEKLSAFVNSCRDDPTRNHIQVPYHLSKLEFNTASWANVKEPV